MERFRYVSEGMPKRRQHTERIPDSEVWIPGWTTPLMEAVSVHLPPTGPHSYLTGTSERFFADATRAESVGVSGPKVFKRLDISRRFRGKGD